MNNLTFVCFVIIIIFIYHRVDKQTGFRRAAVKKKLET